MIFYNLVALIILILLLAFSTNYSYWLLFLVFIMIIVYFVFVFYYKPKIISHLFCFSLFLLAVCFWSHNNNLTVNDNQSAFYQVKVTVVKTNYFIVKSNFHYYLLNKIYYHKKRQRLIIAEIDDTILLYAKLNQITTISKNDQDFDFNTYLLSNNVNYSLTPILTTAVPVVKSQPTIRNKIINYIKKMDPLIAEYTLLFLLQQLPKNDLVKMLANYGVISLLVVSGIHINLLYHFINKFSGKKRVNIIYKLIPFMILFFYLYLLNFPIAAVRACFYLLITAFKKKYHRINVIIFIAYVSLLFSPFQFYQLGWQLTFIISLLIIVFIKKTKKMKRWQRVFCFSFFLFLFTIPIQLLTNQGFSIFSSFYNLFFAPIFLFYYLLFFFYLMITPFIPTIILNPIMRLMITALITIIKCIAVIDIWIPLFKPKINAIYLYYLAWMLLFFLLLYFKWKILIIFNYNLIFINVLILFATIKPYYEITFINVGNAMSILLTSPFQKSAILIDAGIAENNPNSPIIGDYLKRIGIFKLNAIFLTHQHSDHINNLNYLKKQFAIDHIYSNLASKLSYSVPFFANIINYNYQLAPKNYSENNRSLVLCFNLFTYKFLVTGDIELATEKLLVQQQKLPQITFLQVAHHGSKTSTSLPFLALVKPEIGLISATNTKLRPFPSKEVLERLQKLQIKTFWTGKNKTIHVQVYQNFFKVKFWN